MTRNSVPFCQTVAGAGVARFVDTGESSVGNQSHDLVPLVHDVTGKHALRRFGNVCGETHPSAMGAFL